MTAISISQYDVVNWQFSVGATAKLRIFCDTSFITSDNVPIEASSVSSGKFYKELTVTIAGTTATIPMFTIDSTTDGLTLTSARYAAYFYSSDGRRLAPFEPFDSFFVSHAPGVSQSWPSIAQYNLLTPAPADLRYTFDDATIQRLFDSINTFVNPMTTAGDTIIATTGGMPMRLPIGANGTFYKVAAGLPSWAALALGDITTALGYTPLNKAGDTATSLLLAADPVVDLGAATKQYVDTSVKIETLNADATTAQTLTVAASFSELTITDLAGDHKFGLSGPIGVAHGGTGLATFGAAGAIPYASGATTLVALAAGTATQLLHGGTTPSWSAVSLTADVSGILPGDKGGTGIAFVTFAGPAAPRIFTLPDAAATILTTNAAVTVAQGGTGLTTFGAAGAIPYASGATTLVALAAGTATQVLHGGTTPSWAAVNLADDTTGTLTIAKGGTGQTSFGAGFIRSNGSALSSQAVPFTVPDGGTGAASFTLNGVLYGNGTSGLLVTAQGAANTVLTANAGAPAFSATPTLTGLTLTGLTQNSIIFAGASGLLSQNTTRLLWDNTALPDGGLTVQDRIIFKGATNGTVGLKAPGTDGDGTIYVLPEEIGSNDQVLTILDAGTGTLTWKSASSLMSGVTSVNSEDGPAITFATGTSGTDFALAVTTDTLTFNLPSASASARGVVTTGTQTLAGAKTLTDTLTLAAGNTNLAPLKFQEEVALNSPVIPHAVEWDGALLYITTAASARKTIAYLDSNITGSAASITGNLTGDVTSVGMATTYAAVVPLAKGGTGVNLTIGASGTFLRSDGAVLAFSADGSSLTALNATSIASGTLDNARLSGVELSANKGAADGYASLDGSTKVPVAQISEVLSVAELTEYTGSSGSGATAIRSTITSAADGEILTFQAGNWVNSPASAATSHDLLSATHSDTLAAAVAEGSIIIGNATPKWSSLVIGSANTVLRSTGTTAAWAAVNVSTDVTGALALANGGTGVSAASSAALFNSIDPLTTKGDLIVHDGTNSVRQGIGSNDQVLVADGTQTNGLRWGNPAMHPKQVVLKDEFAGGGITVAAGIGELGWQNLAATTVTQPDSVWPNIGFFRMATAASLSSGANLALGATANAVNGNLGSNTDWECTWIFAINSVADVVFHIGFTNNNTLTTNDPNGIYLTFNTIRGDTDFTYICKSGGTETKVSSGLAADTGLHTLKMKSTVAGTVVFTLDGANSQTVSTNVPTATVGPFVMIEARAAAVKIVTLDYFMFNQTVTR